MSSPDLGTLEELKDVAEQQQITEVQSVATVEQVLLKATWKQLSKQEILLADCTAACRGAACKWSRRRKQLQDNECHCKVL